MLADAKRPEPEPEPVPGFWAGGGNTQLYNPPRLR